MDRPRTSPRQLQGRPIPRPFDLPWGRGEIVEEAGVLRPHWEPVIQLLRYEDGSEGLRFCYYHGSRFGRGPTILDEEAIEQFSEALHSAPRIRALLERMVVGPGPNAPSTSPGQALPARGRADRDTS